MNIYIYAIYFPISKKYYIGQTINIKKRIASHFKSGSLVCKALWKYDNWTIEILHTTNKELANQLEIEDIRNHDSVYPNGYNMTHGGEGGDTFSGRKHSKQTIEKMKKNHKGFKNYKHTEESKQKQRDAMIGNKNPQYGKNKGMDNPFYGKHHSKETKEKIQNALQGKKFSKRTRIKMAIAHLKYYLNKFKDE